MALTGETHKGGYCEDVSFDEKETFIHGHLDEVYRVLNNA